jgi:hypothetical protein
MAPLEGHLLRGAINTAEVKGLAERRVQADRAYWKVQYTVAGNEKSRIPELYKESESHGQQIVDLLLENGFEESEIVPGVIRYEQEEFRDENQEL